MHINQSDYQHVTVTIPQKFAFLSFVEPRSKTVMMVIIIMGHECKRGTVGGASAGSGRGKGKDCGQRRGWKHAMCVSMKTA
jgi:hypothetical protein